MYWYLPQDISMKILKTSLQNLTAKTSESELQIERKMLRLLGTNILVTMVFFFFRNVRLQCTWCRENYDRDHDQRTSGGCFHSLC